MYGARAGRGADGVRELIEIGDALVREQEHVMRTRLVEQYMPGVKQFGGAASELRAAEARRDAESARARERRAPARGDFRRRATSPKRRARSPRRLEPRSRARRRRIRGRLYVWNRPPSARRARIGDAPRRRRTRRVAATLPRAASNAGAGPS